MATIKKTIDVTKKPSKKQIQMLEAAERADIVYDDDCPQLSKEELSQFKRVSDICKETGLKNRRQNVTLRLTPYALQKARSYGKGYTTVLSRIIEKVIDNPELVTKLIGK